MPRCKGAKVHSWQLKKKGDIQTSMQTEWHRHFLSCLSQLKIIFTWHIWLWSLFHYFRERESWPLAVFLDPSLRYFWHLPKEPNQQINFFMWSNIAMKKRRHKDCKLWNFVQLGLGLSWTLKWDSSTTNHPPTTNFDWNFLLIDIFSDISCRRKFPCTWKLLIILK